MTSYDITPIDNEGHRRRFQTAKGGFWAGGCALQDLDSQGMRREGMGPAPLLPRRRLEVQVKKIFPCGNRNILLNIVVRIRNYGFITLGWGVCTAVRGKGKLVLKLLTSRGLKNRSAAVRHGSEASLCRVRLTFPILEISAELSETCLFFRGVSNILLNNSSSWHSSLSRLRITRTRGISMFWLRSSFWRDDTLSRVAVMCPFRYTQSHMFHVHSPFRTNKASSRFG